MRWSGGRAGACPRFASVPELYLSVRASPTRRVTRCAWRCSSRASTGRRLADMRSRSWATVTDPFAAMISLTIATADSYAVLLKATSSLTRTMSPRWARARTSSSSAPVCCIASRSDGGANGWPSSRLTSSTAGPVVSRATSCAGAASDPLRSTTRPSSTSPFTTAANEAAGTPRRVRSSSRAIPARNGYAQHEAVVRGRGDRALEVQLHPSLRAGRDLVPVEHDDAATHLDRPRMQQQLGSMAHRLRRRAEHAHRGVDAPRRLDAAGQRQDVATREVVLADPDDVGRDTAAGADHLHLFVVALEPAHAHQAAAGHDLHLVPDAERTIDQRPGDDRSETAHREHAVDRESWPSSIRTLV